MYFIMKIFKRRDDFIQIILDHTEENGHKEEGFSNNDNNQNGVQKWNSNLKKPLVTMRFCLKLFYSLLLVTIQRQILLIL